MWVCFTAVLPGTNCRSALAAQLISVVASLCNFWYVMSSGSPVYIFVSSVSCSLTSKIIVWNNRQRTTTELRHGYPGVQVKLRSHHNASHNRRLIRNVQRSELSNSLYRTSNRFTRCVPRGRTPLALHEECTDSLLHGRRTACSSLRRNAVLLPLT
jgi:hypothetical protein